MRARDVIGHRVTEVLQARPGSTDHGSRWAIAGFKLDNGAVLHVQAVEDPAGDVPYVTAWVAR